MELDSALHTFITEARELLEDMESALLNAEDGIDNTESINAIFRAAHTIKGSAGLFGLDHIVAFTHVAESVFDEVRGGSVDIGESLVVLLLACCDHIGSMVDAIAAGQLEEDPATTAAGAPLLAQLRAHLSAGLPQTALALASGAASGHAGAAPSGAHGAPEALERIARAEGSGAAEHWHISLRFGPAVLTYGMDPIALLRSLSRLGRIVAIATLFDTLPPAPLMHPETCYLGFEIALESQAERAAIEGVFEFVADDCVIRILPPNSMIGEYVRLIREQPATAARIGEMLVQCGSVTARELEAALAAQSDAGGDPAALPKLGTLLVDAGVAPAVVEAALSKQKLVSETVARENRSIRVDADKLDHLIDLVGELIIAGARSNAIARRMRNGEMQEAAETVSDLVESVRDSALQLRMVKIGATFKRFQRVVHDVSREIGKDIALVVSGEDAELDKTVVEKIGDPLTHLVRNAIDHGIESAEVRAAAGKSGKGSVRLNAYHDSGAIVIEVSDDGGGLPRDKILAKAIERGLVEPERKLSDSEIFGLIFEPGFSTADTISKLSGRGVGMDVVKRNITALRGSVSVHSEAGEGTTVTVRLPLTLAIINGFMVSLGKAVFVIPLDLIDECVEFACEPGHDYANLRGEVLPFLRLRELFNDGSAPARRESIVVFQHAGQRAGLVVDALLGEFQTVIKPLASMFSNVKCISGSTILGSGEVALILDVAALLKHINNRAAQVAA